MNYWIISLPRKDMEHCISIGTFGLNSKQGLARLKEGDRVVCCVTKEKPWKVVAFGTAVSDFYIDDKPVFKKEGGFWYRFNFEATRLESSREADFEKIIPGLSFVTNVRYWPVYFKGSVIKISESDWNSICEAIGFSSP